MLPRLRYSAIVRKKLRDADFSAPRNLLHLFYRLLLCREVVLLDIGSIDTPILRTLIGIEYAMVGACRNIDLAAKRIIRTIIVIREHIATSSRRCCWLAIDRFQRGAITECPLSNLRNAIWDSNTCQRGAVIVFTTSYYSIFCE